MSDRIYRIENMEHGASLCTNGTSPQAAAEWFIQPTDEPDNQYFGCHIGESRDGWLFPVFDADSELVDDLMVDVYVRQPRPHEGEPVTASDRDGVWFRA